MDLNTPKGKGREWLAAFRGYLCKGKAGKEKDIKALILESDECFLQGIEYFEFTGLSARIVTHPLQLSLILDVN